MLTTLKYILLTAMRDWLLYVILFFLFTCFTLGRLMGYASLAEEQQTAVAFISSSQRFVVIAGIIAFVCFHIRRSFENKEIELLLTKPQSRAGFIIAYVASMAVISLIATLAAGAFLMLETRSMATLPSVAMWSLSLFLEAMITAAFCIAVSLILRSAVSAVMCSGLFYIAARMMGYFTFMVNSDQLLAKGMLASIGAYFIKIASIILPRLDQFTLSGWLVYGIQMESIALVLMQSIIYIPLLVAVSSFDLERKQL